MKTLLCLFMLGLLALAAVQAQPRVLDKTFDVPASKRIKLDLKFGDNIRITAWDKPGASVHMTYQINGGRLNDALVVTFNSTSEVAGMQVELDGEKLQESQESDCPEKGSQHYNQSKNGKHYRTCMQIDYEIFVPRDANLTVESINGDIELRGLTGPVKAKSISGFVDMNWNGTRGAAVSLKTITGEVYSDLNIALSNKKQESHPVGYELRGQLNGGGSGITLESISNNIYLRKQ